MQLKWNWIDNMNHLFFIFCLSCGLQLNAQSKVYVGSFPSLNSQIYEILPSKILRVTNAANKSPKLFIQGNLIYFNERRSFTDVMYTFSENQLFKGNSSSSFDVLFTLKDGKLYAGDGRFSQVVLYTFSDGKIYRGDSTSTFDFLMSYELGSDADLILVAAAIAPY